MAAQIFFSRPSEKGSLGRLGTGGLRARELRLEPDRWVWPVGGTAGRSGTGGPWRSDIVRSDGCGAIFLLPTKDRARGALAAENGGSLGFLTPGVCRARRRAVGGSLDAAWTGRPPPGGRSAGERRGRRDLRGTRG